MALISGLDLGFIKDEGFRKFIVVVLLMIGLIIFGANKLMPTDECVTLLIEIAAVYAGYNIGTRWLSKVTKKETPAEEKKP